VATGPVEDAVPEGRVTPEGGLVDRAEPPPNGDGTSARAAEAPEVDTDEPVDEHGEATDAERTRTGRHTKAKQPRSPVRNLLEWGGVIIGAIAVAFLVKTFLFQAFWIPSPSMSTTLIKGDRVLVNKLSYKLHDVHRGDVVVFERPPTEDASQIKDLIKRVVAVGGDRVSIMDGKVRRNGKVLDEPYTHNLPTTYSSCGLGDVDGIDTRAGLKIPNGEVFVMGDNRVNSHDGRCFGPIDEDLIVGRAFLIIWPPSQVGGL
jgi:signal peptidase I